RRLSPRTKARMFGADAGRRERLLDPTRALVGPAPKLDSTLLLDRIADKRAERPPGRGDALAADRLVDEDEVRCTRNAVVLPRPRRHHHRHAVRSHLAELRGAFAVDPVGDNHSLHTGRQAVLAERFPESGACAAATGQEREQRRPRPGTV